MTKYQQMYTITQKTQHYNKNIQNHTNHLKLSQLKKLGIKNLEKINKDTFEPKNNFFSARRSIHNKENDYGRNISVIMIN